ncbi:hypothetical protein ACFXGA_16550 [Actinosynnema sp. NPDC059335]|uniref:hypothetical protein n=1 Tax=Actinosynnema sp. NPDC059335 TaxID=3346804 RepID=UPI0036703D12
MSAVRDLVDETASALGWSGSVTPRVGWEEVERRLRTPLPADYKRFMARFPSGLLRDVLRIFNLVQSRTSLTRVVQDFEPAREVVGRHRDEFDSYPPFPEPGGVVPFADDTAGGLLGWLPWTPDPDRWHVVRLSGNPVAGWTRTRRSMTAVVRELATSRSDRNVLGWDLAARDRVFEPFDGYA